MNAYEVKVSAHFWSTLGPLRTKYAHEQMIEIINIVKDCIRELQAKGYVDENGWGEHRLVKPPYNDGMHYEFHIFDDDVLVVYFKREKNRTIRMVGIYDHESLARQT